MTVKALIKELQGLPTGCLCNAHKDVKAMSAKIKPLYPGPRLAGPAHTGRTKPGQNASIHRLVATAKAGEVLVVDGGGTESYGAFGDILASACQMANITGLVIDGTVRDIDEIEDLKFTVFGRGTNPASTAKDDPGEINLPVNCGGVTVIPGDFVVGDCDGVVVIPKALVLEVIELAKKVLEKEDDIRSQLKAGKTTCEIFNIPV